MIKKVLTSLGICSAFVTAGFAVGKTNASSNNNYDVKSYKSCFVSATDNVKSRLDFEQYDELFDVANGNVIFENNELFINLYKKNIYDYHTNYSFYYIDGFVKQEEPYLIDEPYDYEEVTSSSSIETGYNCRVTIDNSTYD